MMFVGLDGAGKTTALMRLKLPGWRTEHMGPVLEGMKKKHEWSEGEEPPAEF